MSSLCRYHIICTFRSFRNIFYGPDLNRKYNTASPLVPTRPATHIPQTHIHQTTHYTHTPNPHNAAPLPIPRPPPHFARQSHTPALPRHARPTPRPALLRLPRNTVFYLSGTYRKSIAQKCAPTAHFLSFL